MKGKTFKWRHALWLVIFLFSLLESGQNALSQEIPNGDGDLLWERPLNGRSVNDAKFHPINGNIIAAVNHEIWEIDPKDGHTIRVFEGGGPDSGSDKDQFKAIYITSDGLTVITGDGSGIDGLILWDYNTGKIKRIFSKEKPDSYSDNLGIFPDNNRIVFYSVRQVGQNYLRKLNIYSIESNDLIKEIDMGMKNIERLALSKDGKYLALGISEKIFENWTFTMELWDAETLTKIQELGSFNVGDFRDIQFSNDNQYIGYGISPGGFYLFQRIAESYIRYFVSAYVRTFSFSNDNSKLFLDLTSKTGKDNPPTYIYNLQNMDSIFKFNYRFCYGMIKLNYKNEIFTKGVDSNSVQTIKLISSKWYAVSAQNPVEIKIGITKTTYTNNSIQLTTEGIDLIKTLLITDTLGKKIYVQNEFPVINNQTEIPMFLPSGNFLLKIISNGKEYTSKFIVER